MTRDKLISGTRTVSHLARYLEELKNTVSNTGKPAEIEQRGYVTPTEEEKLRGLQISYWQTRAALFEVVESFRHDESISSEEYNEAFLIAFAAAILLVDAARFLRETFRECPVIRHKLDEPAEQFGIPEGMHTRVQESLTSPRHAWHLFHANRYYHNHQDELKAIAFAGDITDVYQVVTRLSHRVAPPASRYLKSRVKVRASGAVQRVGHGLFGQALYGLQEVFSSMMADVYVRHGHHPRIPKDRKRELLGHLSPGDVLVVRKDYALTNYFLPGYWPHAALYLGDARALRSLGLDKDEDVKLRWGQLETESEPLVQTETSASDSRPSAAPVEERPVVPDRSRRVLEATKDGVHIRAIDSPLACDSVVVLRPRLAPDEIAHALCRGLRHEGKPYDFDFDFSRSDRLVCTEVVYRAYEGVGGITMPLVRRAGRNTLAAGDLIRLALERKGFGPLLVYSPAHGERLLSDQAAYRLLAEKEGPEGES